MVTLHGFFIFAVKVVLFPPLVTGTQTCRGWFSREMYVTFYPQQVTESDFKFMLFIVIHAELVRSGSPEWSSGPRSSCYGGNGTRFGYQAALHYQSVYVASDKIWNKSGFAPETRTPSSGWYDWNTESTRVVRPVQNFISFSIFDLLVVRQFKSSSYQLTPAMKFQLIYCDFLSLCRLI